MEWEREHWPASDPASDPATDDMEEERVDSSRTMRRIVVAVDGSDGSDMAVHYALQRIADPLTDHLFLLHVKPSRHQLTDSFATAAPSCLPSSPRSSSLARPSKDHAPAATTAAAAALSAGRFSRKRRHDSLPSAVWSSSLSRPSDSYSAADASASFGAATDHAAALLASCFLDATPAAAAAAEPPAGPTPSTAPWQLPRAPVGRFGGSDGLGSGAEGLRHVRRRSVDGLRTSGSGVECAAGAGARSGGSPAAEMADMRKAAVAAALMLESAFESSGGTTARLVTDGDRKSSKAAAAASWKCEDSGGSATTTERHELSSPAVYRFPGVSSGGFGAVKGGDHRAGLRKGRESESRGRGGVDAYDTAASAWSGGIGGGGGSVRAYGRRLGRPMRQQQQHMDLKVARWLERFAREAEQMGIACDTAVVEATDPCEAVLCRVHSVRAHLLVLSGHLADSAGGAAAFASDPHTPATTVATSSSAIAAAAAAAAAGAGANANAGAGGAGGALSGGRSRGGELEGDGVRVGLRGGGGVQSGCPVLVVRPGRSRIRERNLMEF